MMAERAAAAKASAHIDLYKYSSQNRQYIFFSEAVGCFHCLEIFSPDEVAEWTDLKNKQEEQTALCPKCGIDSVIPSGYGGQKLTPELLVRMNHHWF